MKGSIYKRGKTWTYRVDIGRDPITNKRRQISKGGFKTKKDCQVALAKILAEYHEGTYINESEITLKQCVEKWLKFYESTGKVKVSTVRVRKHETNNLLDYFKDVKLKDITPAMYQDFLLDLNNNFSENTLKGIHGTARMVFKKAIDWKYIKSDPTESAIVPSKQKTVEDLENEVEIPKYYERDELIKFLETAKEDANFQTYPMFLLLAYTGMRVGELCALKWKDIDFETNEVRIYKTYYNPTNHGTKYTLLPPKTKGSIRTILVDEIVIKELKKLKAKQSELMLKIPSWHSKDDPFVFTKILKNPGYPETIKQIDLKMRQLVKRAGLEELTPHGLRHTHTTLLAQAGVSLEEIMERLGHKDDKTTRNIYLHITKDMKKEASHKFSNFMKGF